MDAEKIALQLITSTALAVDADVDLSSDEATENINKMMPVVVEFIEAVVALTLATATQA